MENKLIKDIIVKERMRKLLDQKHVEDLVESIKEIGLLEPIIITKENILVSGLHRLEACKKLGQSEIEVRIFNFDELHKDLAEIDENLLHKELSVLEHADHLKRRKEIYELLYPETKQYVAGGKARQKTATRKMRVAGFASDAAKKLKKSEATIYRELQIAENIDEGVKKELRGTELADSKTDLLKLSRLSKEKQKKVVSCLKEKKSGSVSMALIKERQAENDAAKNQGIINKPIIYKTSCLKWIEKQESCDLLLTDPPYMTDIEISVEQFANSWLLNALKLVRDRGRAYICIGAYPEEIYAYLKAWYSQKSSMLKLENILVWTYRNTIGPTPKDVYKLNWQAILYFKGVKAPALNSPIMLEQFSVQDINAPDGRLGNRYHTFQKPDELAERFIRHSTKENDLVYDPFAGTGTFLIAASRLQRRALGCENNEDMLKIAKKRGCQINET